METEKIGPVMLRGWDLSSVLRSAPTRVMTVVLRSFDVSNTLISTIVSSWADRNVAARATVMVMPTPTGLLDVNFETRAFLG